MLPNDREYFEKRVKQTDRSKCWPWKGAYQQTDKGEKVYRLPVARLDGKHASARIVSWMLDGGLPSDGPFVVTCGNDLCVNPDHLEPRKNKYRYDGRDFVERLEYGFYLNGLSEDDDGT